VIRTWVSLDRARATVELVESEYDVVEKKVFNFKRPLVVVVFKPKILLRHQPVHHLELNDFGTIQPRAEHKEA
jgi:hypothetical protein